jgi:hypothetical protein
MPLSPPVEAQKSARPIERVGRTQEAADHELKELVEQIQAARRVTEESVAKLSELTQQLYSKARRSLFDGSSAYVLFANAHLRMAGALSQGMRRTASMDRVLNIAEAEREESRRRDIQEEERRLVREAQRKVRKLQLPTGDDFDEVYGDVVGEDVSHAE